MVIKTSEKTTYLAQKCLFFLKASNKQNWMLSKAKFRPKPSIQNSAYTEALSLDHQQN